MRDRRLCKRRMVVPFVVSAAGSLLATIMVAPGSVRAEAASEASARADGSPMVQSPLAGQPVITLNDNGGWCWFQDQRAIFTSDDRLIVGSVPNPAGSNGAARGSTVEAATYDLRTKRINIDRLHSGLGSDDHNAPAFIETHPGRVVAAWTGHASEPAIHVATEDADSRTWDLPSPVPRPDTEAGKKVSYSNLISLSAENHGRGRLYDFYRGEGFNPNLLISDDEGATWRYGGRLLNEPDQRPYVRYSSNGTDRIDFIASQGHPSDINGAAVRAGYVKNNRVHGTNGTDLGPLDGSVRFSQLTPLFNGTPSPTGGTSDADAWPMDIEQDTAGRPVVAFSLRLPTPPAAPSTGSFDHRYYVGRWTGTRWVVHQVAFGGGELYAGQPDYTGTAAIDPVDPNHMIISTNVDPRTGGAIVSGADGLPHWEIYEGRSGDAGATWTWQAVTHDSTADNIRPLAVAGPRGDSAVLWLRGRYRQYIKYDLDVVGIVQASPAGTRRPTPSRVGGTTAVIAGRFGGGTHDDLFVSGVGTAGDGFVLQSTPRSQLLARPLRATYTLSAFDPDHLGRDTLLAVPTDPAGVAHTWRLNPDTSLTSGVLKRPAGSQPIVGDMNRDGRDDILWYGRGSLTDQLWYSEPGGTFRVQPISVKGQYRPVAGDVDGDGRDDIIWYAPGSAADSIWHFRPGGGHDNWAVNVNGNYHPVAGDFDGDHRPEIVWDAAGPAADYVWRFTGQTSAHVSTRRVLPGSAQPSIGDFDGDGRDDILWNATGSQPDITWPRGRPPA